MPFRRPAGSLMDRSGRRSAPKRVEPSMAASPWGRTSRPPQVAPAPVIDADRARHIPYQGAVVAGQQAPLAMGLGPSTIAVSRGRVLVHRQRTTVKYKDGSSSAGSPAGTVLPTVATADGASRLDLAEVHGLRVRLLPICLGLMLWPGPRSCLAMGMSPLEKKLARLIGGRHTRFAVIGNRGTP